MTEGPGTHDWDVIGPDDFDAGGRYLYPCDVEDDRPESALSWSLGAYLVQTLFRLVADPARDSLYACMPIYTRQGEPSHLVSPDAFYVAGRRIRA